MKCLVFILMLASLSSCQHQESTTISGTWLMHQVIQEGKDVTQEHDPFDERFVEMRDDSTFKSDGRPFGSNTGTYAYNAQEKTLFLDSDVGEEDDSYWKVEFNGDTMTWQGYGSEWAENFRLIHVRK